MLEEGLASVENGKIIKMISRSRKSRDDRSRPRLSDDTRNIINNIKKEITQKSVCCGLPWLRVPVDTVNSIARSFSWAFTKMKDSERLQSVHCGNGRYVVLTSLETRSKLQKDLPSFSTSSHSSTPDPARPSWNSKVGKTPPPRVTCQHACSSSGGVLFH